MPTLIHDGLTEQAYISGELRFHFRPLPIESLHHFLDALRGRSLVAIGRAEADAIAARLVNWSLADGEGTPLPITAATILSLRLGLFRRLREIVIYGTDTGDPDPTMPHDADLAELIADSAHRGATIAELREARDAKN